MNRYTVYLNRPEPDNRVVVYADRYIITERLGDGSTLTFVRDGGESSVFEGWSAVVADDQNAPGDLTASEKWVRDVFGWWPADEEPELTQTEAENRLMEWMINTMVGEDKEPCIDVTSDGCHCPGEPFEEAGAFCVDDFEVARPPITDAALGHLCHLISDLVEMGHWELQARGVADYLGDLIDVVEHRE